MAICTPHQPIQQRLINAIIANTVTGGGLLLCGTLLQIIRVNPLGDIIGFCGFALLLINMPLALLMLIREHRGEP